MKKIVSIFLCLYYLSYNHFCYSSDKNEIYLFETTLQSRNRSSLTIFSKKTTTIEEKESFLENFDFSKESSRTQQEMFELIETNAHILKKVTIKECPLLNDDVLDTRLYFRHLSALDLQGCTEITGTFLNLLTQITPDLMNLNLSRCTGLKQVANSKFMFWYTPIEFPNLEELTLNECTTLERIDIVAPRLKCLSATLDRELKFITIKSQCMDRLLCQGTTISDRNLYAFLHWVPNLRQLDLTGCSGITKNGKNFYRAFFNDPSLTSLSIKSSGLNDEEMPAIGPVLERNTALKGLSLKGNNVGDTTIIALARNTSITTLDLSENNSISIKGIRALSTSETLKNLFLSRCSLSKESLLLLATSKSINKLDVSWEGNVDHDVLKAFAQNNTLQDLDIGRRLPRYLAFVSTNDLEDAYIKEDLGILLKSNSLKIVRTYKPGRSTSRTGYRPAQNKVWGKSQRGNFWI